MAQPPYDPYGGGYSSDPYGAYQQQPPPSQQPAQVHHYYGSTPPPNNGMATASMVLGIIGIVFCGFTSILAIIFGHIAQSQIKRTGEGGGGMATAGLVMGYIVTVIWVIIWIFYLGLYAALVGSTATY